MWSALSQSELQHPVYLTSHSPGFKQNTTFIVQFLIVFSTGNGPGLTPKQPPDDEAAEEDKHSGEYLDRQLDASLNSTVVTKSQVSHIMRLPVYLRQNLSFRWRLSCPGHSRNCSEENENPRDLFLSGRLQRFCEEKWKILQQRY